MNSHTVLSYWLIGREIVLEVQGGEQRAEYGQRLIGDLSLRLHQRYGKGFSVSNLKYFRQFYQTYADRLPVIGHKGGGQLELETSTRRREGTNILEDLSLAVERHAEIRGFSPHLSWSHYRTLLRVENLHERCFYEIEAEKENWSVPHLERQIHTCLFLRLVKSQDKEAVMKLATQGQELLSPIDAIKNPLVLDFLGLPEHPALHESDIEAAIMSKLQPFLLELGKGFAFVARQLRITTEMQHFYIDLVFYNYLLKCFVVIDLKLGKLTHQDIGQLDMYVRMFDDLKRGPGDNPTVGIILCAEKDSVVVKYSILEGNQQLFASQYLRYLPSEEELRREIERERLLIGAALEPSDTPITQREGC